MKRCCACKKDLPVSRFGKNRSKWDGLAGECKECVNIRRKKYVASGKAKAAVKRYNSSPKGKRTNKNGHLKNRYGITLEEYETMFEAQNGVCAVCGEPETYKTHHGAIALCVDHDHKTGKIRGLLCTSCNVALGVVSENKEILLQLAVYLERALQ